MDLSKIPHHTIEFGAKFDGNEKSVWCGIFDKSTPHTTPFVAILSHFAPKSIVWCGIFAEAPFHRRYFISSNRFHFFATFALKL